jgi:regulator of protease activity HflC (stomatin/prohibitin superfamily)
MVEVSSASATEAEEAGLEIRTSDGLSVVVDVSILTRFYPAPGTTLSGTARSRGDGSANEPLPHGGPADLFTRVGIEPLDWDNQIRKVAADELRRSLGALMAGQFYERPKDRVAALDQAREEMRRRLDPVGISVESVLLRRYTYKDDRFDEAIFNKNIQEQEQRLKDTGGELAEVKAELEQVAANWDARVETLRIQGENQAQIIRSEAALYENEKRAQGDLAVARAQAEVDRMKANALASSQGAAVYVAREMAPLISSLRGGVISNIDPYDIEEWARRLGVTAASTAGVSTDAALRRTPNGTSSGVVSQGRGELKSAGNGAPVGTRTLGASASISSPSPGSVPPVSAESAEARLPDQKGSNQESSTQGGQS